MTKKSTLPNLIPPIVPLILALSVGLLLLHLRLDSWTVDEPLHIKSGVEWLTQGFSPTDPFNPPAAKLLFGLAYQLAPQQILTPFLGLPRLIIIGLFVITSFIFYRWARFQTSIITAIFALWLFVFEPTTLAFSHLATTDIPSTLAFFLAIIAIWDYADHRRPPTKLWAALALLTATKLVLLPAALLTLLFATKLNPLKIKRLLHIPSVILALLILVALFRFTARPILDSSPPVLLGELINTAAHAFSFVFDSKFDTTRYLVFFESVRGYGWYSYPLVSLLLKTSPWLLPLALLTLFNRKLFRFWVPVLALLLTVTLGRYSTGIRHLLPLLPFICLLAAISLTRLLSAKLKLAVPIILTTSLITALTTPDYLAYFNPIIGSKAGGRIIADSNLDWGQQNYRFVTTYGNTVDYVALRSPLDPVVYGQAYSALPTNPTADQLTGKRVLISRHLWYTAGYYQNPLFTNQTPQLVLDNTHYLFSFPNP